MHHLMGMKARVSLSFVIKVAESGLQDLAEFHHKTEVIPSPIDGNILLATVLRISALRLPMIALLQQTGARG